MRRASVSQDFGFSAITSVLLVSVLAAFRMTSGKPGKTSQVDDEFYGDNKPPRSFRCELDDEDRTYWCKADGYREQLSTLNGEGLLRAGGPAPDWDEINPRRFDCTGPDKPPNEVKPSEVECQYEHWHGGDRHTHRFRMNEMLIISDPLNPDPGEEQVTYAWPPHK